MEYFLPLTFALRTIGTVYYVYSYGKSFLNKYIINQVLKELNNKQEDEGILFKQLGRTKSAIILYKHGGKEHSVCVPYDRSNLRTMLRKKVFLINSNIDNNKIEITHKPGVPYSLSAKDMGGIKIIVMKDNTIIKEYAQSEIPNYLD